jgi:hypothetical protein
MSLFALSDTTAGFLRLRLTPPPRPPPPPSPPPPPIPLQIIAVNGSPVTSYLMAANTLRGAPDTMVTIALRASTGVEYSVFRV